METQYQHSEVTNLNRPSSISIFAKRVLSTIAVIGSMVSTACSKPDSSKENQQLNSDVPQANDNSIPMKAPRHPLRQNPKPMQSSETQSSAMKIPQMSPPMKRVNRSMSLAKKRHIKNRRKGPDNHLEKVLKPHCLTTGGPGNIPGGGPGPDTENLACD